MSDGLCLHHPRPRLPKLSILPKMKKPPIGGETPEQMLCHKKSFFLSFFSLAIADNICRMMETKEKDRKMTNTIVLNTVGELVNFLNETSLTTLVDRVAFGMDLLDTVRANENEIAIDNDLGFCDDGGFIRIDDMGYVVEDFGIC